MTNKSPTPDQPEPITAASSSQTDANGMQLRVDAGAPPPPQAGDNFDVQAEAELVSRVADLQCRLEPLMRLIDGEVEVCAASDGCTAPGEA